MMLWISRLLKMDLDKLSPIGNDELVEVTPTSIRLRNVT